MTPERYRLSFTTGGLFLREAPLVAERYLTLGDWSKTRRQVRSENLLQVRTASAATRLSQELIARLELLDTEELDALLAGRPLDRGYLLWAATCRRYAFIRDFAVEMERLRRQLIHALAGLRVDCLDGRGVQVLEIKLYDLCVGLLLENRLIDGRRALEILLSKIHPDDELLRAKLMTNLQTVAESLATKCDGRAWIIVTAQEEMSSVLGDLSKQQSNDFTNWRSRRPPPRAVWTTWSSACKAWLNMAP